MVTMVDYGWASLNMVEIINLDNPNKTIKLRKLR